MDIHSLVGEQKDYNHVNMSLLMIKMKCHKSQ